MGTFTDSGGPCAQTEALALHRTAPWGKEDANGRFAPALGVLIEAKPGQTDSNTAPYAFRVRGCG